MQIRTWSLLIFIGLAGGFCVAESAIAPLVAQAYTSRVNITLERQPNESFQTLTRRAETVARAAAQRSFDNDILVTQAAVVVTVENGGLSAPILSLDVDRDNWKNYPNAQRWSTYFPNAQALLKIANPTPAAVETQPGQSTQPTNSSGTGTQSPTGTTSPRQSTTPTANPATTPANRATNRNSPANRAGTATGTGTGATNNRNRTTNQPSNQRTNRTGTNTPGTNSTTNRTGTNRTNTQQRNSTNPAARGNQGANNNPNQTATPTSPPVPQPNTQPNRPRSRPTYGEGLIRRTRELRDDINNRPPTDLPEN